MAEKRLYVGNLPSDTNEDDLQKFFKKFKVSKIELKKKDGFPESITFAYVNIPENRVQDCLEQCEMKKYKNSILKIQIAKESFLDRLKKERDNRNEKNLLKNNSLNQEVVDSAPRKNRKIVFNDVDDLSVENNDSEVSETVCEENVETRKRLGKSPRENDLSDDEIPRKRNLPMFRGTASVSFEDEAKPSSNVSMKRFEEFSDVWRDSSPEKDISPPKKSKWKWNESLIDSNEGAESSVKICKHEKPSKFAADCKRVNALEEKWNTIKEKKNTIKKALKSLKTNRTKVKFSVPNEKQNDVMQSSGKKMTLFEDDDASDDDFQVSFDVKKYLDGKNGLKMLNLKSKLSNDERFKLDGRFCDDNYVKQEENPVLTASDSVTPETDRRTDILLHGPMIRYDPTRPDHKTLEKPLIQSNATKKKKKKKIKKRMTDDDHIDGKSGETETPKPEVSKEKYYSVSDSLRDAFKKPNETLSFSLSAMFDEKVKQYQKPVERSHVDEAKPIKKLKSIHNPFENTSESDEEGAVTVAEEPVNVSLNTVSVEKVLGKSGVWGEKFFFQLNDPRFKEAVKFYTVPSKSKHKDFAETRKELKKIFRKKLQNSRRDRKLFKQKLGGSKLNRTKFQKRLKKTCS